MHWPGTCKVITRKWTCGDARAIDRHTDPGISLSPQHASRQIRCKVTSEQWLSRIFPTNVTALSRIQNTASSPAGSTLFSVAELAGQNRDSLDLGPCALLRVAELNSCFDMPASNTSVPRPAARRCHQGYNLSVEPSSSHRVLVRWGVSAPRTASPPAWLLSSFQFRAVLLILTQGRREQMFWNAGQKRRSKKKNCDSAENHSLFPTRKHKFVALCSGCIAQIWNWFVANPFPPIWRGVHCGANSFCSSRSAQFHLHALPCVFGAAPPKKSCAMMAHCGPDTHQDLLSCAFASNLHRLTLAQEVNQWYDTIHELLIVRDIVPICFDLWVNES